MNAVETSSRQMTTTSRTFNRPTTEGDWHAYLSATSMVDTAAPDAIEDALAVKRELALGYLGKRAQNQGAVYSRSEPRVLTTDLAQQLATNNRNQRYARYPWLERMVTLLAEIEHTQQEICLGRKVLPFPRGNQ